MSKGPPMKSLNQMELGPAPQSPRTGTAGMTAPSTFVIFPDKW